MLCTAELVPHTNFHKGSWVRSSSGWYYFIQEVTNPVIFTNSIDYNKIDPQLTTLVKYLHSKGIGTTPSCQGHFYDAKYYKRLYSKLQKDCIKIRGNGLMLINEVLKCKYGNRTYKLPWTESEFIDKVLTYQTTGVLGFTDENRKYYDILQFTKQKNITITHDSNTTLVVINSESEEDMINNWKVVESLVKNIIGL